MPRHARCRGVNAPENFHPRGVNARENFLLKGVNAGENRHLSVHSALELNRIARRLNGRPRETLGWKTPAEKLDEFLAKSAAA